MPPQRTTPPVSSASKPYSRLSQTTGNSLDLADEMSSNSITKSEVRGRRQKSKPVYIDSDDEIPALSTPGSGDNDRSSDYDPVVETPSKPGLTMGQSLYTFDDEEEDEDSKPDDSDDEISHPGIVRDIELENSEEGSSYGKKGKGKARARARVTTEKKKVTPKKGNGVAGGSGKKPGVGWSPEQDWIMFQDLHPKVSRPNWEAVAKAVGRDAKSCSNRYATMSKNLEGMVKGFGRK